MCTELYIVTTDPHTRLIDLFRPSVFGLMLCSILIHTVLYVAFFNLGSYVFYGKRLNNTINKRLIGSLVIIMFLGFFGRLMHVKEVYAGFRKKNKSAEEAKEYVDKHYSSWIFMS